MEFAKQELGIELNIQAKRSKIEYIGSILCKVSNENSGRLEQLVETLDMLLNNESKMAELKNNVKSLTFHGMKQLLSYETFRVCLD